LRFELCYIYQHSSGVPMKNFLSPQTKETVELLAPAILKRLTKEKRGQGVGKHYKPFLTVRDVPSRGRVHRRPALTHGRIVHLLSDLELSAFLLFDWDHKIVDIREQYPLDPEKTRQIAERLGIKHPAVRGVMQVMTTDFVIDILENGKIKQIAISVKYHVELEDERVVEKQELERRYWEGQDIDWFLFTEKEVPIRLIQNIKWLMPHIHSFDLDEQGQIHAFETINQAIQTYPVNKIAHVMKTLDEVKGQQAGTYLAYMRHLLAQNAFTWDLSSVEHQSLSTNHLSVSEFWINKEHEYVHAK
jgi:hypothetical protein